MEVVLFLEVGETNEHVLVTWGLKQVHLMVGVQGGELGIGLLDHLVLLESFQASELVPGCPAWGVMKLVELGKLGGIE